MTAPATIRSVEVLDVRFPTSDQLDGSDALHTDPDYSSTYVILRTDRDGLEGHGTTFTIGRGNELCAAAARTLGQRLVGLTLAEIQNDMRTVVRGFTQDSQLRWVGPEKGVVHLATAAVVNALWDLLARAADLPLWRFVCELEPERLVGMLDFSYVTDALTPDEAVAILRRERPHRDARTAALEEQGYPAYTTSCGWLGYSDTRLRELCAAAIDEGWNDFKLKVGVDPGDDDRRCGIVRELIGPDRRLMIDANQRWDVDEAIAAVNALAHHDLRWIEEPTSPDDVLGHARIAQGVAPVHVATGEQCQNRVVFKQLMQAGGVHYVQVDACRVGGLNEVLVIMLLARRFGLPVCPHAGGVGLCEYVNHLVMIDYVMLTGSTEDRITEYVSHLDEHFVTPARTRGGRYFPPLEPGYGTHLRPASLDEYRFPDGPCWSARLAAGSNGHDGGAAR
jgi:L-fuconate dehydratase